MQNHTPPELIVIRKETLLEAIDAMRLATIVMNRATAAIEDELLSKEPDTEVLYE